MITLEQALQIALSENVSVNVADKEIERSEYARKGSYASLFPQVSGSGSYQRTIKKQVMYMDSDGDGGGMASMFTGIFEPIYNALGLLSAGTGVDITPALTPSEEPQPAPSSGDGGISVGRWNTFSGGVTASMPW